MWTVQRTELMTHSFCCSLHKVVLSGLLFSVVTRYIFLSFNPRHQLNKDPELKMVSVFTILVTLKNGILNHFAVNNIKMVSVTIIGTLTNGKLDHCAQQSRF